MSCANVPDRPNATTMSMPRRRRHAASCGRRDGEAAALHLEQHEQRQPRRCCSRGNASSKARPRRARRASQASSAPSRTLSAIEQQLGLGGVAHGGLGEPQSHLDVRCGTKASSGVVSRFRQVGVTAAHMTVMRARLTSPASARRCRRRSARSRQAAPRSPARRTGRCRAPRCRPRRCRSRPHRRCRPAASCSASPSSTTLSDHRGDGQHRRHEPREALGVFQPDRPADLEQAREEQIDPRHGWSSFNGSRSAASVSPPKIVQPIPHATIGMNAVHGNPVRSQSAPQITGVITAMCVADGEHAAGHAVHVVGRAQARRQAKGDDERDRGENPATLAEITIQMPSVSTMPSSAERRQRPEHRERPALALQPLRHAQHDERGDELRAVEPAERRTDQVAAADAREIVGHEAVDREVQRVVGAEARGRGSRAAGYSTAATSGAAARWRPRPACGGRGAAIAYSRRREQTGADHTSRSSRQLPPTSGSTSGMVSAEAAERRSACRWWTTRWRARRASGAQSRTSVGSAGWKTATPKPISMVAA